jgi:hypothetical protein
MNVNMEGDISYEDYVDLRMIYSGRGNCGYFIMIISIETSKK